MASGLGVLRLSQLPEAPLRAPVSPREPVTRRLQRLSDSERLEAIVPPTLARKAGAGFDTTTRPADGCVLSQSVTQLTSRQGQIQSPTSENAMAGQLVCGMSRGLGGASRHPV
jgi:hypothetical protein